MRRETADDLNRRLVDAWIAEENARRKQAGIPPIQLPTEQQDQTETETGHKEDA